MSIEATQQYIVHLDIRATAPDPAQAVQDALGQVLLGGIGDVACRVEQVAPAVPGVDPPTVDAAPVLAGVLGAQRHADVYRGEFLG